MPLIYTPQRLAVCLQATQKLNSKKIMGALNTGTLRRTQIAKKIPNKPKNVMVINPRLMAKISRNTVNYTNGCITQPVLPVVCYLITEVENIFRPIQIGKHRGKNRYYANWRLGGASASPAHSLRLIWS